MNEAQLFTPRVEGMRIGARRLATATALTSLLALGACSSTPDWANPVEWYKGATSVFDSDKDEPQPKTEEAAELRNRPVPGAGEPFPNLGTVPERPKSVTPPDERKRITASLVADRDNARYVDPPPPRPTVTLPPPTRADAPATPAAPSPTPAPASQATAPAAPAPVTDIEPPPPPPPAAVAPRPNQSAQATPRPQAQPAPPQAPTVSAAPRPRVADSQPTPPPPSVAAPPEVVAANPLPPARINGPTPDAVVLFNDGSSQISADQRRGLAAVVRDAKARDAIVRVVGRSPLPRNQSQSALLQSFNASWNRAHAVADALARLGMPAAKIRVEAETAPENAPDVASVPQGDAGLRRADIYLE